MSARRLFKYVSSGFKRDEKTGKAQFQRIEGLLGGSIRFSQPDALNDPFEMERFREQQIERSPSTLIAVPTEATLGIMRQVTAHPTEPPLGVATQARDQLLAAALDWLRMFPGTAPTVEMTRRFFPALENRSPPNPEDAARLKQEAESIKATMNYYGILSLTQHNDNLLMWAHYAEEHRGVVFEIDIEDGVFCAGFATPTGSRERIEGINEWRGDVRYCGPRARPALSSEELIASFFLKSPQWEYEHEYRIIRRLKDERKVLKKDQDGKLVPKRDGAGHEVFAFPLPPSCIKSLIFGARNADGERREARDAIIRMVRSKPEFSHIALQQAHLSLSEYALEIGPIGD